MGIYILNFLLNFHCVIIHRNIDIGIEYLLEKVLTFSAETTSHEFHLNISRVIAKERRIVEICKNYGRKHMTVNFENWWVFF